MSKLKDSLGNELEVGDLVQTLLKSNSVVGSIIAINPGSTLAIRGNKHGGVEENVTPGTFLVRCDLAFAFDPRENHAGEAFKLVKPPQLVEREAAQKKSIVKPS